MSDKAFNKLDFSEEYKKISAIWNMKRVPHKLEDEKDSRIPNNQQWSSGSFEENEKTVMKAFKYLVETKNEDIVHYCLDEYSYQDIY